MTTALIAFASAFAVGALATALMCRIAPLLGAIDQPDGYRKIHRVATPRLGGIGVFAGFLAPIILMLIGYRDSEAFKPILQAPAPFLVMIAAAGVVLLMGVWDDIRPLRPAVKLFFQALAAAIAMLGGHVVWRLSLPWLGSVYLGAWGVPLTLFWFLGCMNAINLLDGMDGLAGGVSLIVCITMMLVGQLMGNTAGMLLMACLGGGILGFLVFNFHPARIFLGDSGSNAIGFLIAALAIMTSRKSQTAVALLVPIIALGLPITDTALAILRRWSRGLPLSAPDRQHIHHLLLALGLSQQRAVLLIYGVSVLLCMGAILSISGERDLLFMVFGAMGLLVFVCVRVLGSVRLGDLRTRLAYGWHCRQASNGARIELERCSHFLPHATTVGALWEGCGEALTGLDVDEARLLVLDAAGNVCRELAWHSPNYRGDLAGAAETWQVRLSIMDSGHLLGRLVVAGEVSADRLFVSDRLELIWRFRDLVAVELPRLVGGAEMVGDETQGERLQVGSRERVGGNGTGIP